MPTTEIVHLPTCSLWTTSQGCGPALVCLHGGPGLWDYLEPVAGMLDDLTTTYRYDQRACGRSTGNPPYDVATAVSDLETLREHWQLPQWIVLGHSWGATLALAYCLTYPSRVCALIYISGTGVNDLSWKAEQKVNQAALLTSDEQQQLATLKAQLSNAQNLDYDAIERVADDLRRACLCQLRSGAYTDNSRQLDRREKNSTTGGGVARFAGPEDTQPRTPLL